MAPSAPATAAPASAEEYMGRFDSFFGGPARPTPSAKPQGRQAPVASSNEKAPSTKSLPPPYGTPESPAPAYGEAPEPATLPKSLFKYGFVFPPFWVIGACILLSKLDPEPEVECGKAESQQREELALLRRAEVKWSKRCLMAFCTLLVLIAIILIALWAAHVGAFKKH